MLKRLLCCSSLLILISVLFYLIAAVAQLYKERKSV